MIKIFLLSFLFYSIYCFGQYSSGVVEYGIEFNENNHKKKFGQKRGQLTISESFRKKYGEIHRKFYAQDAVFIELKFNKNSYCSKPVDVMIPESISGPYPDLISRNDVIYGDFKKEIFLFKTKTNQGDFVVKNKKNYCWVIKDEYRTIAGYRCRKAKMKFENNPDEVLSIFEVWFTPEIPVAFSPVRYHGLPGAILGMKNFLHFIYAKQVKFTDDVTIKKPANGKKISFKEYRKMITRFKPD